MAQLSTPRHMPKEAISYHRDACSPVFTVILFTTARKQNNRRCPHSDERIKCDTYIHIYYSVIKKSKIIEFARKSIDLESIILSAVTQTNSRRKKACPVSYVNPGLYLCAYTHITWCSLYMCV